MAVQLRGKNIEFQYIIVFLCLNSKVCKRLQKKLPMGKKIIKIPNCPDSAQINATESPKPYTVLFIYHQFFV